MKLTLKYQDLFLENGCYYAHCVSRDYALGMGIAVQFNKRYDMRYKLKTKNDSSYCILIDNVFNLVTKYKYWDKPTYNTLKRSLLEMKAKVIETNIKKIAMPKIGCGLDRLQWDRVEEMLYEVFGDLDIEIVVCYI